MTMPKRRNVGLMLESCVRTSSLGTVTKEGMESDVGGGIMFTVESLTDPIDVYAMELNIRSLNATTNVEVYTRLGGNLTDAMMDHSALSKNWTRIVNAAVPVWKFEGLGTLIPEHMFTKVSMQPNEQRSFYVILQNSDLGYIRTDQANVGTILASDDFLQVHVGVGLSQNRVNTSQGNMTGMQFNGYFHYKHATDCQIPRIKTQVTYPFYVKVFPTTRMMRTSKDIIMEQLNDGVRTAMEQSIGGLDLQDLRDNFELSLDSITTVSRTVITNSTKCPFADWAYGCVLLDTIMIFSHLDNVSSGIVEYSIYKLQGNITQALGSDTLQVVYGGNLTLTSQVLLAMKGVPVGVTMNDVQKRFLGQEVANYLSLQLSGVEAPYVLGAEIIKQRGPDSAAGKVGTRRLAEAITQDDWIEVTVEILTLYTPPLDIISKFDYVVLGAIRKDPNQFIKGLVRGHEQPGSLVEGSEGQFFSDIYLIKFNHAGDVTRAILAPTSEEVMILGIRRVWVMVICGGIILLTLLSWIIVLRKMKRTMHAASEQQLLQAAALSQTLQPPSAFSSKGGKAGSSRASIGTTDSSQTSETKFSENLQKNDPPGCCQNCKYQVQLAEC